MAKKGRGAWNVFSVPGIVIYTSIVFAVGYAVRHFFF